MNRLAAILAPADVLVDVEAADRGQLFDQAGSLFERNHAVARTVVWENLQARERLGSTGLGHGVAIPHGRIKGLKQPVAALLKLRRPIAFGAPDSEAVGLFVFLFVPEAATQHHLEILSEIAELLSDRELRDRMAAAGGASALYAMVSAWNPTAPRC